MSSRLKKKLGNLGVDPSSARANESFCLIGTPLPPLEKSKDNGEFVPLWKQDVRDEKGRRRLHGAFTGGFSAGYFNTVGSKEGFTPSTFISSRGDRSKKKASRPEDFMDEEDLQELKDSRDLIDTTDEMELAGGMRAGPGGDDEDQDSVARALEASMLPAAKDSAGARILKKMGWRIGQGIGPRVTLRQRKLQDMEALSGRRVLGADVIVPDDDEEASKHTYAPRDTPILVVERKDNTHGLGYHPGMGLNESVGGKSGVASGPKLASGFGLGALNDADEDDLDVYDGGFAQSRNRTAYDIIDREEEEKISIGSRADGSRSKPDTRPASSTQTFHDGQPLLAGFVLSTQPVAEDRWFPLPDMPKGWKPDPKRVWDKDKENSQTPEGPPQAEKKWSRTGISADQRGSLLGETPLPSAPRSVFEFMSQKDRERLKNIASSGSLPPSSDVGATDAQSRPAATSPATITIPRTEPHIALSALRGGFLPFATNPDKHARYTAYLESQASVDAPPPPPKPMPGQKIDEFNKELEDYAKAALIFKPLSGAMAGRFTSATIVEHGPKIHEGLYTPSAEDLAKKEAELQKIEEEKISPKAHAAQMGMYGPMTRETQPWQPAKLLCKRFKVKEPNPPPEVPADAPPQAAYAEPTGVAPGMGWDQFSAPAGDSNIGASTSSGGRRDLSNVGLGEDETQGRDTLTYQRPAMDVFKAIFASDDEDSDDDAKDDNEAETPAPIQSVVQSVAPPPQSNSVPDIPMPGPDVSEAVDVGTFKPTFIPREGKAKKDSDRAKDKKEKKEKKKKEKVLVSFQEDGEDGALQIMPKDRPKKKRRKDKQSDEDASMWVEKPAPDVVKAFPIPTPSEPPLPEPPSSTLQPPESQAPKGRKRAIDFM